MSTRTRRKACPATHYGERSGASFWEAPCRSDQCSPIPTINGGSGYQLGLALGIVIVTLVLAAIGALIGVLIGLLKHRHYAATAHSHNDPQRPVDTTNNPPKRGDG